MTPYDTWRLSKPDAEGDTCDACGTGGDLRIFEGRTLCNECYWGDGDSWNGPPTPAEHAQDMADERGDWLYEQRKDG